MLQMDMFTRTFDLLSKIKRIQLHIIVVKLIITMAGGIILPAVLLLRRKEAKHIWEIIITIRRIGKTIGEIILRI